MAIPHPHTPFVGRREEIARIADLLGDPVRRLVTVTGAPGVGKTRLAVEAARAAADRFPSGVVEASFAGIRRPELVPQTLLAAAGCGDIGSSDPSARLTDLFEGGGWLVVADNLEQVVESGPLFGDLLRRCSGLHILATSRQPLRISDEQVMVLEPFPLPDEDGIASSDVATLDAISLLAERLRAAGAPVGVAPPASALLGRVCRLLDGLPLAIELAAARGRVDTLESICSGLEQGLLQLDRGPRDADPRHRTMRAAISWSTALLSDAAATVFRHAGVFPGGTTLEALSHVLPAMTRDSIRAALDELADHNLVRPELTAAEPRYRMLEVVRQFAIEQLNSEERQVSARRHAEALAALASEAAVGLTSVAMRASLDRLEVERDNLRAALNWALEQGDVPMAEALCLSQRMLWYVRGPLHEGCAHFADVLAMAPVDAPQRCRVLIEAAALERQRGALGRAAELAGKATATARQLGDPLLLAAALLQQGFVTHLQGLFPEARALLEESRLLAAPRDDLTHARALHHLGIVLHFGWALDAEAMSVQLQALEIYRAREDRRQVGTVLLSIAELHRCARATTKAHAAASEALAAFQVLGDLPVLSYALHCAAAIAASECRYDRALRLVGAADHVERLTGAPTWPVMARFVGDWLPNAMEVLGDDAAKRFRESGARLEPEQAIALGREEQEPQTPRLSLREREVAALVAAGLTNREIATRLFLSERTIDGHVARILTKLDFRTRTQIAAWVSLGGGGTAGTSGT